MIAEKPTTAAPEKAFTAPPEIAIEDVAAAELKLAKAAYDKAITLPVKQAAEPYLWWNLWARGPLQILNPNGPLSPSNVIKVGETVRITTTLMLNPIPILPPAPGISPLELLSDFGLQYEVHYQTGNLTTWNLGQPQANVTHTANLIPHQGIYTDVLQFVATQPGLMEMNITARILGNPPGVNAPHFAGFARYIYNYDPELFWIAPTPGWQFDQPVKFMVYP